MEQIMKPAIVAIGYNRPKSLKRLLKSIGAAEYGYSDITLIISIDFWKEDNYCYNVAEEFEWMHGEKIIIKQKKNLGLRDHVLSCGDLSNQYGAVILLEDDIAVSEQFYNFAISACDFYRDREEVVGIGLYTHHYNGLAGYPFYPVKDGSDSYYERWVITWGECFCRKQWNRFRKWYEHHKGNDLPYLDEIPHSITDWPETSWSKYLYYYMLENDCYFVSPYESYTTNFADVGVHAKGETVVWQASMQRGWRNFGFSDVNTAIKYDMYFENMDIGKFQNALGISGSLCIDLNGLKPNVYDYDYCLSTRNLPYKIMKTFGLQVKPIEENVFQKIPGEGIFLYDMKFPLKGKKCKKREQEYELYRYHYPGLQNRKTLNYIFYSLWNRFRLWGDKIRFKQYYVIEKMYFRLKKYEKSTGDVWMFHSVEERVDLEAGIDFWISPGTLEKLINNAFKAGKMFKAVKELKEADTNSIYLTFDDGYEGVYLWAYPILKKHKIPFTFFVTVDFVGCPGYVSWEELKEMNSCELCTIGGHTVTHPRLRMLEASDAEWEIRKSKEILEKELNQEITVFAYPYGNMETVARREMKYAKRAGYKYAFSTLQMPLKKSMIKKAFFIPRWNINEKIAEKTFFDKVLR